jgi:hypothetical protein
MPGTVSTSANANYNSLDGNAYYLGGGEQAPLPPEQPDGAATIVCDGQGGYQPQLNFYSDAPCGITECVTDHELSHANDWAAQFPDGCDGQPEGGEIPLGGPGYDDFLKASECDAYTREANCERKLLEDASPECKPYLEKLLDDRIEQQKKACTLAEDEC